MVLARGGYPSELSGRGYSTSIHASGAGEECGLRGNRIRWLRRGEQGVSTPRPPAPLSVRLVTVSAVTLQDADGVVIVLVRHAVIVEVLDGAEGVREEPVRRRGRRNVARQRERSGAGFHRRAGAAPGQLVAAVKVVAVRGRIARVGAVDEV